MADGLKSVKLSAVHTCCFALLLTVQISLVYSDETPLCARQQATERENVESAADFRRFINISLNMVFYSIFSPPAPKICVIWHMLFRSSHPKRFCSLVCLKRVTIHNGHMYSSKSVQKFSLFSWNFFQSKSIEDRHVVSSFQGHLQCELLF